MTGANECALLQPITSLVSSFIFIKPECVMSLYALPSTSLAESRSIQTDADTACCSKECYADNHLFPMEPDFCVNLDRLFSDTTKAMASGGSQSLLVQSFHPCSLTLPTGNILTSEFYADLYQQAKTEESNYSNSMKTFQESLSNPEHTIVECQQETTCSEPGVSQAEAVNHFKLVYQHCVGSNKNEEELFESLTEAVKKLEDILNSDEVYHKLLCWVNSLESYFSYYNILTTTCCLATVS